MEFAMGNVQSEYPYPNKGLENLNHTLFILEKLLSSIQGKNHPCFTGEIVNSVGFT